MPPKSRDGLRKVAPGKYVARIVKRDDTGAKIVDTERVIRADSKLEAAQLRAKLVAELTDVTGSWTVGEALDSWLAVQRSGSRHSRASHGRKIRAAFGARKLTSLSSAEIQRWVMALPGNDTTARNIRSDLACVFRHARAQGRFTGRSPVDDTSPRRTPKTSAELLADLEAAPSRALLGNDLARFFRSLRARSEDVYVMEVTQLILGTRFAEVSALQWPDLDLDTGAVAIRRSQYLGEIGPPKGKRQRPTALGPAGRALLRAHRERMAQEQRPGWDLWVFPRPVYDRVPRSHDLWPYSTVAQVIREARQEVGLPKGIGTHAMRHAFTTLARASRADDVLRLMVGHQSSKMTEHYTSDDGRRAEIGDLAAQVETLVGGVFGGEDDHEPSK